MKQDIMDQFYTSQSILLVNSMLTTIFRLGPFTILEIIFMGAAVAIWQLEQLPSCYYYTLGYFALITFLIEMIVSLRLIKRNTKLRKRYISRRINEGDGKFYCRIVWDNINIIIVVMLIYSCLVADGIKMTSLSNKVRTQNNSNDKQLPCEFTLFSLCLFAQLEGSENISPEDGMIMWLLYSVTTFLSSTIFIVFSKQYYQYCANLTQNRRLLLQFGELRETFLDCSVYCIACNSAINKSLSQQIGECSICLHNLVQKSCRYQNWKVIKLSCSHLFHKQCIQKWLKVKDHCPFRCYNTQEQPFSQ